MVWIIEKVANLSTSNVSQRLQCEKIPLHRHLSELTRRTRLVKLRNPVQRDPIPLERARGSRSVQTLVQLRIERGANSFNPQPQARYVRRPSRVASAPRLRLRVKRPQANSDPIQCGAVLSLPYLRECRQALRECIAPFAE